MALSPVKKRKSAALTKKQKNRRKAIFGGTKKGTGYYLLSKNFIRKNGRSG